MALTKVTRELTDIFGCDADGNSLLRQCVRRTNSGLKRKGEPVTFVLDSTAIPPANIRVFVGNSQATNETDLDRLSRFLRSDPPEAGDLDSDSSGNGEPPDRGGNPHSRQVELTIDRDLATFGDEDLEHFMLAIKELLKTQSVRAVVIRRGSVKIVVEIPGGKVAELVQAVEQGALDRLDVVSADPLSASGEGTASLLNRYVGAVAGQGPSGEGPFAEPRGADTADPSATEDKRLKLVVARVRIGDRDAENELLRGIWERLSRLASVMIKQFPKVARYEETEDVLQRSMIRLRRTLTSVRVETVNDLYRIAAEEIRRELLDLARVYTERRITVETVGDTTGIGVEPLDQVEDPQPDRDLERWAALHEQVGLLPDSEREVFELAWYHGLPTKQVATVLGQSERAVRRTWASAKRRLAEALGADSSGGVVARAADPETGPDKLVQWADSQRKAKELPPDTQVVFDLIRVHGKTLSEVAEILGVSVDTVKKRWTKARLELEADDDPFIDRLLKWDERAARGEVVSAADLCPDRPDLVQALSERMARLKRVAPLGDPVSVGQATGPWQPPAEPFAGRYRLDEMIGEGRFGVVWRGYDLALKRPVAVKVLQPDRFLEYRGGQDAFLAEARRAARLSHPGVIPVFDVGGPPGPTFIVTELIDGVDLGRRLREGPMPVREAVRVVELVARHLHYAHRQGFVHRDIKPANILLGRDGRVYVADFGIAASADNPRMHSGSSGTVSGLAPERFSGDTEPDPREDVYSLGMVLYELLTGRLPFDLAAPVGETTGSSAAPRPIQEVNPAVPPEIERLCLQSLATDPTRRPPTAEDLADQLARSLAEPRDWNDTGQAG